MLYWKQTKHPYFLNLLSLTETILKHQILAWLPKWSLLLPPWFPYGNNDKLAILVKSIEIISKRLTLASSVQPLLHQNNKWNGLDTNDWEKQSQSWQFLYTAKKKRGVEIGFSYLVEPDFAFMLSINLPRSGLGPLDHHQTSVRSLWRIWIASKVDLKRSFTKWTYTLMVRRKILLGKDIHQLTIQIQAFVNFVRAVSIASNWLDQVNEWILQIMTSCSATAKSLQRIGLFIKTASQ